MSAEAVESPMDLSDRVALVTGAAAGIGRATVERLASVGARVAGVDVDQAGLEVLGDLLPDKARFLPVVASALEAEQVQRTVGDVTARWDQIDILVNCVGGSTGPGFEKNTPMDEMGPGYFDAAYAFNVKSTVICIQRVLPGMKSKRYGRIVNLTSRASYGYSKSSVAYATMKAAIVGLTKRLSREVGPFGITCNAVAPGMTSSPRVERDILSQMKDQSYAALISSIPLGRVSTPEDQAAVVAFLVSPLADYVTGAVIDVDGGRWR